MASGFFALLDDISVLMDDVAAMSKITAKKTAGILGDDLAVNAEKASGFLSSREIPVLWAITKGSFLNKLIILPFSFLLSAFFPALITYILLLGGFYLAYEGVEKIYEFFFHKKQTTHTTLTVQLTKEEILTQEKSKIKSAIITDFILSVEIIIIALGTVIEKPILTQILVVTFIAIIVTIGVYGIVALIVRMDDFGYKLIKINKNKFLNNFGAFLINALPKVIKSLTVFGTLALLLVAGGIFIHNIHAIGDLFHSLPSMLADFIVGLIVGIFTLLLVMAFKKIRSKK